MADGGGGEGNVVVCQQLSAALPLVAHFQNDQKMISILDLLDTFNWLSSSATSRSSVLAVVGV